MYKVSGMVQIRNTTKRESKISSFKSQMNFPPKKSVHGIGFDQG